MTDQGQDHEDPDELANFIRDQVCCPRVWGCELGGSEDCPAERVRRALKKDPTHD